MAKDAHGFIKVNQNLQSVSHSNVFGAGDCITIQRHESVAKAGVYAVREGPILSHNLLQMVESNIKASTVTVQQLTSYTPQSSFLKLVNMGDGTAVCEYWGFGLGPSSLWWYTKDMIDRKFMNSFPFLKAQPEKLGHFFE